MRSANQLDRRIVNVPHFIRLLGVVCLLGASNTVAAKDPTPLTSDEFSSTGHTLRKDDSQLFLGTQYYQGLSDELSIGTNFLGLLQGPNVSLEYALVQDSETAFSIKTAGFFSWSGPFSLAIAPTYTLGGPSSNRINASLGYQLSQGMDGSSDTSGGTKSQGIHHRVPGHLSYDLLTSEQTTFRFNVDSYVFSTAEDVEFSTGVAVNKGWNWYRLALGIQITNMDLEQEFAKLGVEFEPQEELPIVYPLPTIQMWWRF